MLPVSLYNRTVLSADGAALSYTLVVIALCFSSRKTCEPLFNPFDNSGGLIPNPDRGTSGLTSLGAV
jgi:hypothetical protein